MKTKSTVCSVLAKNLPSKIILKKRQDKTKKKRKKSIVTSRTHLRPIVARRVGKDHAAVINGAG